MPYCDDRSLLNDELEGRGRNVRPSWCRVDGSASLQEGSVVEAGNHSELMVREGLYSEMWTRQAESSRQAMAQEGASASHDGRNVREAAAGSGESPPAHHHSHGH